MLNTLAREPAPFDAGAAVACPSYFRSNMHERVVKNGLAPGDIARLTCDAVESNESTIVPRARARSAWQVKVRARH